MRLYMAATTEYARRAIDEGFIGVQRQMFRPEDLERYKEKFPEGMMTEAQMLESMAFQASLPSEVVDLCEFRDMPPEDIALSRTAEVHGSESDDADFAVEISGGPVLFDNPGDFVLSIDVPDDLALGREVINELGWPFREFHLAPEEANEYRQTLKVYDSQDGEEVRPDLVGR